MINILFTIPNFDTAGSGKVVYDLIRGLDKTKFKIHLLVNHTKGDFFATNIRKEPIVIIEKRFKKSYHKPFLFFREVLQFGLLLKKHKIDLLHSWDWSSNIFELVSCKLFGVKYGYTKKAMSWGSRSWILKSKYSNFIIRLNDDIQTQLFTPYKIKSEKIYIGLDTNYYNPEIVPKESITKPYFLTVANLVPIKGVEFLIRAFEKLNRDDIDLYIVGNNENEYGEILKNMTFNPNIIFINKVLDVRPYLRNAMAYFIPTINVEGQPMALVEAMSMECLVYGSNISGINEVLREFPDQLIESKNEDAILNKMIEAIGLNESDRFEMTTNFRKYVLIYFAMKEFISKHENLYLKQVSN